MDKQQFRFTNNSLYELQPNGQYLYVCKIPVGFTKAKAIEYYYSISE